jgi:phosphatidylserine decarboxylase
MLRQTLAPLHPDGVKFVATGAAVTVLAFLIAAPFGWVALVLTLWVAYFFRDPWRVTPIRAGLLVSPADGRIVSLGLAPPPPELQMGEAPVTRIGIFLDLFSVHVARAPVGGRVAARCYTKGRFLNASLDKASEHNERLAMRIRPEEGPEVGFALIAGLVARRIVCDLREGQEVGTGQRVGIIRFGSRVDVYCPPPYVPQVVLGQQAIGGETVLADRLCDEAPRRGMAQ